MRLAIFLALSRTVVIGEEGDRETHGWLLLLMLLLLRYRYRCGVETGEIDRLTRGDGTALIHLSQRLGLRSFRKEIRTRSEVVERGELLTMGVLVA